MDNLKIFQYTDKEVRTVIVDNGPWWVLKDVCSILDITNATDVAKRLDEDEVTRFNLGGLSGEANIINESGLYNVILRSDKPQAKDFKRWITKEVIPSIRKHGAYMTPEKIEEVLLNPDTIIQLATHLKEEQAKNKALLVENSNLAVNNQIMSPKADYFDELVDRNLLTNFRETAKQMEIKQGEFIKFLLDNKYIYRDKRNQLMPYAAKNNGLFELKEGYNDKTKWAGTQTLITPKGRETFRLLYLKSA